MPVWTWFERLFTSKNNSFYIINQLGYIDCPFGLPFLIDQRFLERSM